MFDRAVTLPTLQGSTTTGYIPSSSAELLSNLNSTFVHDSSSAERILPLHQWRLRPRDVDFTVFSINDFTTCVTHLVNEDGKHQELQHRAFTSNGFSRAFRRTAHLFQPFLDCSDLHRLQCVFPDWDPHYNDMPLCTPLPCLYRRLHGFGRDHTQVSTAYTDVAPYFLFHMAWPFFGYYIQESPL